MTDSEPGSQGDTGVSVWVLVTLGVVVVVLLSVTVFFLFDGVFDSDASTTVPEAVNTTVAPPSAVAPTTITTSSTTTLSTPSPIAASTTTAAAEPAEVIIEEDFEVGGGGSFSAISDGLICGEGSVLDEVTSEDTEGGENAVLEAETLFTCADGSGTFTLTLFVVLYPDFTATFDWIVKEGTGRYSGLRGSGTGTGVPVDFPLKHSTYEGQMTLD